MFPDFNHFKNKDEIISVVGLGYVGLPLAVLLGQQYQVVGFDLNPQRIAELQNGIDKTGEVSSGDIFAAGIMFTGNSEELSNTRLIIVAVPTPIDKQKLPDLRPLQAATGTVGKHLSPGTTVVYESTVYPGVTEDICLPLLEKESGLKSGTGFRVGYSPERINPGDSLHPLSEITKVVSGQDLETTKFLAAIYGEIITAGVYPAPDIKTAEAAKVIENIQRDLNIALINELAIIFHQLGIDTRTVLEAAATKWNFIKFDPGLVGGHCIGVDPYYLTYKTQEIGYHPEVILAGRRINMGMGKYIAEQTVKCLISLSAPVKGAQVLILGFTFKENIKDIRNTNVIEIYKKLEEYGAQVYVYDPLAIPGEVEQEYGLKLADSIGENAPYDAIIVAVKHREFTELNLSDLSLISSPHPLLIDVKAIFSQQEAEANGFLYWRL